MDVYTYTCNVTIQIRNSLEIQEEDAALYDSEDLSGVMTFGLIELGGYVNTTGNLIALVDEFNDDDSFLDAFKTHMCNQTGLSHIHTLSLSSFLSFSYKL